MERYSSEQQTPEESVETSEYSSEVTDGRWSHRALLWILGVFALVIVMLGVGAFWLYGAYWEQFGIGTQEEQESLDQITESEELETSQTELWIISTKVDTVFIQNAVNDRRESYENSYENIESVVMSFPVGHKIQASEPSPANQDIFFVTTRDEEDNWYAHSVDVEQKTFTSLVSGHEHPGFKNVGIATISPNGAAVLFYASSCWNCGGDNTVGLMAYHVEKDAYLNLHSIGRFRWTDGGDFEYKPKPDGCGSSSSMYDIGSEHFPCDQYLTDSAWVQGAWDDPSLPTSATLPPISLPSPLSISAPRAGTEVAAGDTLLIAWSTDDSLEDDHVSLNVRSADQDSSRRNSITGSERYFPTSGTHEWNLDVMGKKRGEKRLLDPGSYYIEAILLREKNPTGLGPASVGTATSSVFTIVPATTTTNTQ